MHPNSAEAALILTIDQWKGLIDPEGRWLSRCCGNISSARDALIESLLTDRANVPGAYTVIDDVRCGEGDENASDALTSVVERLRGGAKLSAEHARVLVLNAGTHDVIEGAFFPEKAGDGPSWATEEASPWPSIVAVCRDLLGDFRAVIER